MEIGMREWLIVIGGLLLLAVLIDGFRRMSNARSGIRMSKGIMGGGFEKDIDEPITELPNGGARVVGIRDPETGSISPIDQDSHQQDPLLDDDGLGNISDNFDLEFDPIEEFEPDFSSLPAFAADGEQLDAGDAKEHVDHEPVIDAAIDDVPESTAGVEGDLDEVIVISVVAKHPKGFKGEGLFKLLQSCGLELGDMGIFHRHEYDTGKGPVQFSVANLVNPGIFNLDEASTFTTPGITFFLGLPGPDEPMKAFEYMLETAKCVAANLGGELKDELRSAMTEQTMEHSRQRVRDFERLQLSVKNA